MLGKECKIRKCDHEVEVTACDICVIWGDIQISRSCFFFLSINFCTLLVPTTESIKSFAYPVRLSCTLVFLIVLPFNYTLIALCKL